MNPILFQHSGPVIEDKLLTMAYYWSEAVCLTTAQVTYRPPNREPVYLDLEIDGAPSGVYLTLYPEPGRPLRVLSAALQKTVLTNQVVRWRARYAGLPEESASEIVIMVQPTPNQLAQQTTRPDRLEVRWIHGSDQRTLFTCSAAGVYTLVGSLPTALEWTQDAAGLSVSIDGVEQLRAANGKFAANQFIVLGNTTGPKEARVLWVRNDIPLASLSATAFRVPQLAEGDPDAVAAGFLFYGGETCLGSLTSAGLTARELIEGIQNL